MTRLKDLMDEKTALSETEITGITCDSRQVKPGFLFVCIHGAAMDGHAFAKQAEAAGADGVSLINTLLGMRIDLRERKPLLANRTGGLSGPAVRPVAVRMVYEVYDAVKIPVVGMGGIVSAEDVIEFMLAGASAVEVGAANLTDPFTCRDIVRDLPRAMEKYGIDDLADIIGGAH